MTPAGFAERNLNAGVIPTASLCESKAVGMKREANGTASLSPTWGRGEGVTLHASRSEEVKTMPEYEFECRTCKKIFTLMMRISERLAVKIQCPACGSEDVETLMQTFVAKTAKKS